MSDALFPTVELGSAGRAGYRLKHLEVFNWGTFHDRVWRLTPDGETALLTGDIGSGKSTLVDAVTTLLMPAGRIAYNKAAGADARERTLRSYVEGHYKSERVESSGRSRAVGLRTDGTTYSVIVGVFSNDGFDETISLAQVFQQRDPKGQPYRFFVTATRALDVHTDFGHFGTDLKALRKRLRSDPEVTLFDDYPKYASSLRRLLGIRSQQALELFHQTVSMKSVGNLNEFVRDHMLEPADASGRVAGILSHFDDLTKAHDAVRRAREQLEVLTPLVATSQRYDTALSSREAGQAQLEAVRLFVAEHRAQLLADEVAACVVEETRLESQCDVERQRRKALERERETLIEERSEAGGNRIGELERLARDARTEAGTRLRWRGAFDDAVGKAGLAPVGDADAFAALLATTGELTAGLVSARQQVEARRGDAEARVRDHRRGLAEVAREVESLEQRSSNLPAEQVMLRELLCDDLGLTTDQLPFAGELLDVSQEHGQWRGAAERVLRGFALSLLVPDEHYRVVSAWVNERRLELPGRDGRRVGARLTYERVSTRRIRSQAEPSPWLRLADCLEVRDGPFAAYLEQELQRRADHRCAEDLAEFRDFHVARAVTRQGQVRNGDRHVKDDRHRADDPRRWVLGWGNERKLQVLQQEVAELQQAVRHAEQEVSAARGELEQIQGQLDALNRLGEYRSWTDLDHEEATARAQAAETERARLEGASSRLVEITRQLEANSGRIARTDAVIEELTKKVARLEGERVKAEQARAADDARVAAHPDPERARASYPALITQLGTMPATSAAWEPAREQLEDDLGRRIERLHRELGGLGQGLLAGMNEVLRRWPELRVDLDPAVEARDEFVALHRQVSDDDLPRFEEEFKQQLNTNTVRELAQFNAWLRRQAEQIDDRVAHINEALGAIDYNPGRYVRLEKQNTNNSDVIAFREDLRRAVDHALSGDHYSEQRFLDVKAIIERFRGREGHAEADRAWTRRVTDVRNWFVFSASERDHDTDEEWEHYSDSDGKSGGQKEKLAYTILAASLAYQFGLEWGVERSRDFRFAVIDEAFGRGSDASTRYALTLFAKLGLQLLIITPLQKVQVIEPYVRAIGYVDNPGGTNSRLHTMTIEEYRSRRGRRER
ncbi:hypothetical protein EII34_10695 [Arachnia propionica]|uniref:Uncharacterized protein n=1 Tax=Arachnia propionica TaxID=1750 RepID=A0A3P1T7A5_9ACTN|nr:ATP-binding protein [Arachnia propionica]RRD04293.1 hypothetical protein EII34_10695 [Arachnia propionica]